MHAFINRMALRNSVNAALQRAGVYANGVDSRLKREFKERAKAWLVDFAAEYDRTTISEDAWCEAIGCLSQALATDFGPYLRDGRVKVGVSQKMISLYLKYCWLLGEAKMKPLFAVVDRGVMQTAGVENPPNWTQLDDREEYLRIVRALDAFAKSEGHIDGASWEAEEWSDADEEEA
ncbi:MAG TPA: hypothetical protein PKK58_09405 [Opitutaceae bacterium]|nr:hypothetical protein [Opitutaceae bacterium]